MNSFSLIFPNVLETKCGQLKLNYWHERSEYLNHVLTLTKYWHSNRFEFWCLILHHWQLRLLFKIQMLEGDKKLAILCLKDVNLLIKYIFWIWYPSLHNKKSRSFIFFPIILYPDFLYRSLQNLIGIETRQTNKSKYAPIYSMHMAILSNSFFPGKLLPKIFKSH